MRTAIRRFLLGDADIPQQCELGLFAPQREVQVELHGAGDVHDVTHRHLIACAAPFTIAIGVDRQLGERIARTRGLSLHFKECPDLRPPLGEIRLRLTQVLPGGDQTVCLFQAASSRNRCFPALRLWLHYGMLGYQRWRAKDGETGMVSRGVHATIVSFICPRPVGLVSVLDKDKANIFPMNLMGAVGPDSFAFALHRKRKACGIVRSARRLVLSGLPYREAAVSRQLRGNHRRDSIALSELPFATKPSATFGFPVPSFALNVREMKVEDCHDLGSHALFIARIVRIEEFRHEPQLFMIHGMYQSWRERVLSGLAAAKSMEVSR